MKEATGISAALKITYEVFRKGRQTGAGQALGFEATDKSAVLITEKAIGCVPETWLVVSICPVPPDRPMLIKGNVLYSFGEPGAYNTEINITEVQGE